MGGMEADGRAVFDATWPFGVFDQMALWASRRSPKRVFSVHVHDWPFESCGDYS